MKIPGRVDDVVSIQQQQGTEVALGHLRLHLLYLALVPCRRQTVGAGRGWEIGGNLQNARVAEAAGRGRNAEGCGSSGSLQEAPASRRGRHGISSRAKYISRTCGKRNASSPAACAQLRESRLGTLPVTP